MEDSEASRPGVRESSLSRSHKSKDIVGGREANLREPGGLWERLWWMGTWDFDFVHSSPRRPSLFLNKYVVSYI